MSNKKKTEIEVVSIITTFYNAETFILNAINSVAQQQVDDSKFTIEYVIVDDKSKDKSREIVERFIENNKHNKKINYRLIEPEENLGCGGARKFGIDNATGDYFMFLDADDYYMHTDFVLRAYKTITEEKADIVEWGVIFNQPDGRQVNNSAPQKIIIENNPSQAEIALFKDNLIKFNVWCKIYTRAIVESFEYSTTRTYEDVRTIPVWVHNAKKIVIMPQPEINYRSASGSIIRNDMVETRLGTITAIAELFPRFKDDYNVLKAMYQRAMVDLEALLHNHSSNDRGFNEMSRLNTFMLKYIYPKNWQEITYHVEDDKSAPQNQALMNQKAPEIKKEENPNPMNIDLKQIPGWDDKMNLDDIQIIDG